MPKIESILKREAVHFAETSALYLSDALHDSVLSTHRCERHVSLFNGVLAGCETRTWWVVDGFCTLDF